MKAINTRQELGILADELGTRPDWHEPDEQGLTARVTGYQLDNAMGSDPEHNRWELLVLIEKAREDGGLPDIVASINLATLLAWASEHHRAKLLGTVLT